MSSHAAPICISGRPRAAREVRAVATCRDDRCSHSAYHATLRVSSDAASNRVTFWNGDPAVATCPCWPRQKRCRPARVSPIQSERFLVGKSGKPNAASITHPAQVSPPCPALTVSEQLAGVPRSPDRCQETCDRRMIHLHHLAETDSLAPLATHQLNCTHPGAQRLARPANARARNGSPRASLPPARPCRRR